MIHTPGRLLLLLFAVIQMCFLVLLAVYDWHARLPVFLSVYLVACLVYAVTVRFAIRGTFDVIPHLSRWIVGAAVLMRLTVFWCPPTLSEDVYRYIWDGKVQNAGFGPYDYAPQAVELEGLRDADYEKINHKNFRTAYPPAAQILFRMLSSISTLPAFFKLVVSGFDLLLLFLLRRLLSFERKSPALLLIYAWHPLAALEFSSSGHMDVISISLLFLSLLLLSRSRNALSGLALGASVMTKYLPAVLLPWALKKGGWKVALGFIVILIILFIPYYTLDLRIFHGLSVFYRKWWFNDSVFGLLRMMFGSAEPARLAGAAITLAVAVWCWFKTYSVYRAFFLIHATIIVFAPVVHPWYVCWLIPFLVFHRNPVWLFFTCWIAMSYLIRYFSPVGVWQREVWLGVLVYAPLYVPLIVSALRSLRIRFLPSEYDAPRL